jgi:drug/metabolite transporter (DMT)-like permease
MSKSLKAHLALLLAQIIYGANYSISKIAMPEYVQPLGFIFLRVSGAAILFWITGLFIKEKIEPNDKKKLFLLALFGVCINQILFYKGLNLSTPINASIIMISNPIIVLVFTAIVLKERITGLKIGGIIIGLIGALGLLVINKNLSFGSNTFTGDMLVLINSVSWAIYIIMVKPMMQKYNAVTILKWIFLIGFFYSTPFTFNEVQLIDWQTMPTKIIWCIAFVVIATTFFAYLLNTYALNQLSPSVVSIYIYMQPFLASVIAIAIGQDSLDAVKIISGLLIITGVYLVSKPSKTIILNNKE